MTDLVDFFARGVREFGSRVHLIEDGQWHNPTPCADWSVRDLVNHLVYEDLWAPELFAGRTVEEVGDRFEGDLLGDAPHRAWDEASAAALNAVRGPGALERKVHLSSGERPGHSYVTELLNDHVVHAWDLARGIGADDTLDPELVEWLLGKMKPVEDKLKESGMFGEQVEVPENADAQTKLLAVMGRRA